ncbi:zinc finger protein ZFAT-like [Pollicipes pollicipes]|uniref:zinc finger protein ZFAT-like n=1 Tax=Pollicipes pollicipes TaxID=41117 RepID=UPI0018854184|nr:zinc finger protein ZFAT-like [Pollicipes pollicipes]
MDDGSSQGRCARFVCDICGHTYRNLKALGDHKNKHKGLTVCPVCRRVLSNIPNLRMHLRSVHRLERDEIYRIIPPQDQIR